MDILITGGVGHIGSNIVIEAITRGHRAIVMDNLHREAVIDNLVYFQKNYSTDQFQFVWGDVRNIDDFDRIPKVNAIIHLAANPGIPWSIKWPRYDFTTNAGGTLNTLEFARKCGNVPFVYASTNKTFSDVINTIPYEETETRYKWNKHPDEWWETRDICIPGYNGESINDQFPTMGYGKYGHSMYGISKLTGELYATEYHVQYGLPVVINKMSCIYGLFQKGAIEQGWINFFIRQIMKGEHLIFYGTGKQVRDVLDARDVARLYIDEIEKIDKCNGEVFTVGGGPDQTVSLIEAQKEIIEQLGKPSGAYFQPKRPADQDIYISNIWKVKEILGWNPKIPFKQTVSDMIREIQYE